MNYDPVFPYEIPLTRSKKVIVAHTPLQLLKVKWCRDIEKKRWARHVEQLQIVESRIAQYKNPERFRKK